MARYSREFFELQVRFVQSLSKAFDCRAVELLYDYTMFRGVLSSERLAADVPRWKEFVAGFEAAADPLDWTYEFYLRYGAPEPAEGATTYRRSKLFGPFTYDTWPQWVVGDHVVIRPHFHTRIAIAGTLLGKAAQPARIADLRDLFVDVRHRVPDAESVRRDSWLYNVEAYRRLFPSEYIASMEASQRGDFAAMSRWGQFFDRQWRVIAPLAQTLISRVEELRDPARLIDCFPYPTLNPQCDVQFFYAFYGIEVQWLRPHGSGRQEQARKSVGKQVLIRHSAVTIDPHERPDRWTLSADGAYAATQLRADTDLATASRIYSSPEPKALATARAVASGRRVVVLPPLVELDRRSAGWLGSADEYAALVAEILQEPEFSIHGCESAVAAQARVVAEIDRLARDAGNETIAVVSHGIVLTLYVSWLRGLAAPDLDRWRRLRFPDVAIVDHGGRVVVREFGAGGP